MQKRVLLTLYICLTFSVLPLMGDVKQYIQVLEYIPDLSTGGRTAERVPLPMVEINVQGAGTTVTDDKGCCTLHFRGLSEGDHMNVRVIAKPGYQLRDEESIHNLIIRRDGNPIVIMMISQENFMRVSQYIEKLINAQIEKKRKQALSELDEAAQDYERRKREIEQKYDAKLDDIEQYIDRLISLDVFNMSEIEQQAYDAYVEGDIDKVLSLLEESNLIERYRENTINLQRLEADQNKIDLVYNDEKQRLEDVLYHLQCQVTLLQMEGSEECFHKAMSILERMLEVDPLGPFQVREYVTMCVQCKRFDHADSLFHAIMRLPDLSDYQRCRMGSNLATILYQQMKYDEAWTMLQSNEALSDSMLANNPDDAMVLFHRLLDQHMLGSISMLHWHNQEAVCHYRDAFNTYLHLRRVDAYSRVYDRMTYPRLKRVITELGIMGEWALADSIYQTTYPRVEALYSQGSVKEKYIVASYNFAYIFLLRYQKKMKESFDVADNLLPVLEKIYEINPTLCEDDYRQLLYDLIGYNYEIHDMQNVVMYAERWFENFDLACEHMPESVSSSETMRIFGLRSYVQIRSMYAYAISQLGDKRRAESLYWEVINMMESNSQLSILEPLRLSACYANVAEMMLNRGDLRTAKCMAERALQLNPDSPTSKKIMEMQEE